MIGIFCLLLIFAVWGSLVIAILVDEECADMYEIKNPDPIQNEHCYGCEFYNWDAERKEYVCGIKGCYENSKFVEFDWRKYYKKLK